MTVEQASEWTIDSALAKATDLATIVKNKLAGGFIAAIDTVVNLASSATNEQVKVTASRTLIRLALELGAVKLDQVTEFEHAVAKELKTIRGNDDD
jgi:hypothetical protein